MTKHQWRVLIPADPPSPLLFDGQWTCHCRPETPATGVGALPNRPVPPLRQFIVALSGGLQDACRRRVSGPQVDCRAGLKQRPIRGRSDQISGKMSVDLVTAAKAPNGIAPWWASCRKTHASSARTAGQRVCNRKAVFHILQPAARHSPRFCMGLCNSSRVAQQGVSPD